MTYTGHDT